MNIPTDQIGQAAIGLGVAAGAVWTGWQSWQAKREAKKAAAHSYPLSNGWGASVGTDLAEVRDGMRRIHQRMDAADRRQTTADERDAELTRSVREARSYARTAAEQSAATAAGLSAHLADHASADATREVPA